MGERPRGTLPRFGDAREVLVEAALLRAVGFLGARLQLGHSLFVPATVSLLCFMMGLQNAVITKVSQSEIRTTHVTGVVTDLGSALRHERVRDGDG